VTDIPIIFELVIVGFEVLAWILPLAPTLFGFQWIELNFVTQWATQLSTAEGSGAHGISGGRSR
jgi:hypothetical protein